MRIRQQIGWPPGMRAIWNDEKRFKAEPKKIQELLDAFGYFELQRSKKLCEPNYIPTPAEARVIQKYGNLG